MDSKESEANIQDAVLQQRQPGHTPYPPTQLHHQHPEYPNQFHIQPETGYPIPPIPPPQFPCAAYPDQPFPVQQMTGYQPQPFVVVNQPMTHLYPQQMAGERPVPNYMYLSIFTTLCCCCCLGIGAIVYSSQANEMKYSERRAAKRKAETALRLNLIGIVIGGIIAITFAVLQFIVL